MLEGQDVIDFYEKMANFKQSLAEKGITRESVRKNAMLLKSIFKDDRDNVSFWISNEIRWRR